ncbi:hypothetical protein K474DRAFT_1652621 [Panus rudis PR-1116 ss-1]|nr:hypothetical protein K474DRAFT_1652621 [Panus rudis PR-1116 ss-1]
MLPSSFSHLSILIMIQDRSSSYSEDLFENASNGHSDTSTSTRSRGSSNDYTIFDEPLDVPADVHPDEDEHTLAPPLPLPTRYNPERANLELHPKLAKTLGLIGPRTPPKSNKSHQSRSNSPHDFDTPRSGRSSRADRVPKGNTTATKLPRPSLALQTPSRLKRLFGSKRPAPIPDVPFDIPVFDAPARVKETDHNTWEEPLSFLDM